MKVRVSNRQRHERVDPAWIALLVRAVEDALSADGVDAEVAVTLVSDQRIRWLNRHYRGVDRVTDVLSFSQREGEPLPAAPVGEDLLGDVVISVATARRQARMFSHAPQRELAFLAVHGTLHLLGYDHGDSASERTMMEHTEAILSGLGLSR